MTHALKITNPDVALRLVNNTLKELEEVTVTDLYRNAFLGLYELVDNHSEEVSLNEVSKLAHSAKVAINLLEDIHLSAIEELNAEDL